MRTRFAPSPTGPLHLGHAFSALTASQLAQSVDGTFLLRIEDIDQTRARPHWEQQIYDDLSWLGLSWPEPVMRQSDQMARYNAALNQFWADGLLYACDCNRRDIHNALSAPQEGAPIGPDGVIYPGTCRHKARPSKRPQDTNLRLDTARAAEGVPELGFSEALFGTAKARFVDVRPKTLATTVGDVVLSRKDMGTSYHLSVVLDDASQDITDVVRGEDLFDATQIHVFLQHLMGLNSPKYHHHHLIRDPDRKRLAKRDNARAISTYRADGLTADDVKALIELN